MRLPFNEFLDFRSLGDVPWLRCGLDIKGRDRRHTGSSRLRAADVINALVDFLPEQAQ